jgi:signal recognition particle subunit SRP54
MAAMQEELAKLDPKALEQLAPDLKDALQQGASKSGLPKGLPGLGGGMPKFPGLGGGLPGLGGGLPKFPGLPGKKK